MLTLEETGMTLSFLKVYSILNILPIQVDVKNGRIQKQSIKSRVFIWKIFYGVGICHWFYVFARLVQSTILEPEKYFRWDHFVLHFGMAFLYAVFYFTGFRLFIKTPEENVIIFNQLLLQPEDPVQKMVDQSKQLEINSKSKSGNKNENQGLGNAKRVKSGIRLVSSSAGEPHEEIQMEVIENPSESESEVGPRPRPLLTWPPQYSLNELLAKLLPSLVVPTGFFMVLILAIDPTRPQFLYSSLPPEYQNVSSFLTLLAVEVLCVAVVLFTASFAIVTQVMFFSKCQLEFKRKSLQLSNIKEKFQSRSLESGGREIRRENWILSQVLKEMRELVVSIELFNRCFPFCIFPWKIYSLSLCIVYYFFVIRHFEHFPLLAVFMVYCAIGTTVIYSIMYANAFSIPGKMEELKNKFLLTAQKTTSKSASASTADFNVNMSKNLQVKMKREIKRIRSVGVKVGSFHQMERESTPNFYGLCLEKCCQPTRHIPIKTITMTRAIT